jgi:Icc-related predicted phosphoesterase
MHRKIDVPDGDVLVHAGDITGRGELDVLEDFNMWLGELPHKHKVVICGNHDFCFERSREKEAARATLTNCVYLQDEEVVIDGVKFYGTPWQPWFYNWAFNLKRPEDLGAIWSKIPNDTDVLLVHGPPQGKGDLTINGDRPGCTELLKRIQNLNLKLVVTGHIHEGYGLYYEGETAIINASVNTVRYEPINDPVVWEI